MPSYGYTLLGISLFILFVALGQAVPNLESMLINFKTLTDGTQSLMQWSFLGIGFALAILLMNR